MHSIFCVTIIMEYFVALIAETIIQDIKSRISIVDIMRDYAVVENKGGGFWAKCPFHGGGNERTASMKLNEENGTYHCFGCGESGDIFTLIQKKEGLNFKDALYELARRAGVDVGSEALVKSGFQKGEKERLYELYDEVRAIFERDLISSSGSEKALSYLKKRGVSDEMIKTFSLGYASSDYRYLYRVLSGKYDDSFLSKSGLFSKNKEGVSLFRDRLIFPIRNRLGKTVAFSGRDLSNREDSPKYINSPETIIYRKKEMLFGEYEAKDAISKGESPILCEGNFDVVALFQAGLKSAVAPLGTSYTEEQARALRRWMGKNDEIRLLFDSDSAGENETHKAIVLSQREGLSPVVLRLKRGKDSSEVLEKCGKEALLSELSSKESPFDFLLESLKSKYGLDSAKGKKEIISEMKSYIFSLSTEIERDEIISKLSKALGVREESLRRDLEDLNERESLQRKINVNEVSNQRPRKKEERIIQYERFALYYLSCHRNLYPVYKNKITYSDFQNSESSVIYNALERQFRMGYESDELFLNLIDDEDVKNSISTSFALDTYQKDDREALDEAVDRIILSSMERSREKLVEQIQLAERDKITDELVSLLEMKQDIDRDIKVLKESLLKKE